MLAGVWVLVLVPLMAALEHHGWTRSVPVPTFFRIQGDQSLDGSYVKTLYAYLTFFIGVVLLFSKERDRQRAGLDWTRRWGVISSYLVALLGSINFAIIAALVIVGIAAMGLGMPRGYEPAVTPLLVKIGTGYLWYGPHPGLLSDASLAGFSAIVVLLACVPLFNALRSSGPKQLAAIVLVPLALASVIQVVYAGLHVAALIGVNTDSIYGHAFYFNARLLGQGFEKASGLARGREFTGEAIKWLAILAIALWLTIAQIAAIRRCGQIDRTAT